MDGQAYLHVILSVNGILLLIVGYFINRLVGKVDETAQAISNIDKSVAVLVEKTKQHETRFSDLSEREAAVEEEIKGLRYRMHDLGNTVNGMQLIFEQCKECTRDH